MKSFCGVELLYSLCDFDFDFFGHDRLNSIFRLFLEFSVMLKDEQYRLSATHYVVIVSLDERKFQKLHLGETRPS